MARNAHPEVTRTRILDAAQRLFIAQGYEHTSIQNIVDELGDLSKGAIYLSLIHISEPTRPY